MSRQHRFDTLRARMTPQRRTQNAATTQAVLADMPLIYRLQNEQIFSCLVSVLVINRDQIIEM